MTEQEIIQYLKDNKDDGKGVSLGNMPEEVQEWIGRKFKPLEDILVMTHDMDWCPIDDFLNLPFALSDNYELPQKLGGKWVEFEINKGKFNFIPSDMNGLDGVIESWWNWQEFLTVSSKHNLGFTAFGGWQYEDSKRWYLAPAVKLQDGEMWNSYVIEQSGEATPVIPVKIRFWKEYK